MATYKVIQDIEAEDKLLGPLSLRQFLYAVVVAVLGFIAFRLGIIKWYLALPFLPPIILFGILAAPFVGGQQPSETWLLAKIRFYILPRKKIWNQSGAKELVKITAPKNVEPQRTDNLSLVQVNSRLKTLASTLDSRGWAVKNVDINEFDQQINRVNQPSDRLVNPLGSVDMNVMDVHESDDMLDETINPVAQTMQNLIVSSNQAQRARIAEEMQAIQQRQTSQMENIPTPDEEALSRQVRNKEEQSQLAYSNMRSIEPRNEVDEVYKKQSEQSKAQAVTTPVHPDILTLAHNDDLNVSTIAKHVNRSSDREVIISLH